MSERLKLGPAERANPLWPMIERYLNQRLKSLQAQLEGPKDIDETNRLRGRIQEVRALLDCAKDMPVVETIEH